LTPDSAAELMAWVFLLVASMLEPAWATAIKQSDGLTKPWPSALGLTGALVSVLFLTFAMKDLSAGTAYAVFVGLGAVGVVVAGAIWLGESLTLPRLFFLALILVGVVGLHFVEDPAGPTSP